MLKLPYLPRLSIHDPAEVGEGPIDPLGLALIADRLANELVPGFTERSRRPCFLVVLALGSRILSREPYPDGVQGIHADGPANVAFERLVLEALGQKSPRGDRDLVGVPGIGKAREATEAGARLSSGVYLMHPGAVGLWVAYKRLARELQILDEDGHLLENGFRLLAAWEEGLGQPGLATGSDAETEDFLGRFDRALLPLLGDAPSRNQPQREWTFICQHLMPGGLSAPEGELLRQLLTGTNPRRAEAFAAVREEKREGRSFLDMPEAEVLRSVERRAGSELGTHVRTILAYERVVVLLRRAFRCLLFVGGQRTDGRIDAAAVLAHASTGLAFRAMPAALSAALDPARELLEVIGHGELARESLDCVQDDALGDAKAFYSALLDRHRVSQRQKPPDGNRAWIDGDGDEGFVRTRYIQNLKCAMGARGRLVDQGKGVPIEARSVVEELANGDLAPGSWRSFNQPRNSVFKGQLPVLDEEHHRLRGEWLRDGGNLEDGVN